MDSQRQHQGAPRRAPLSLHPSPQFCTSHPTPCLAPLAPSTAVQTLQYHFPPALLQTQSRHHLHHHPCAALSRIPHDICLCAHAHRAHRPHKAQAQVASGRHPPRRCCLCAALGPRHSCIHPGTTPIPIFALHHAHAAGATETTA